MVYCDIGYYWQVIRVSQVNIMIYLCNVSAARIVGEYYEIPHACQVNQNISDSLDDDYFHLR